MSTAPRSAPEDATLAGAPRRASWGLMLRSPLHVLALGAGSGLSPVAPGTVGTAAAWGVFLLLQPHLDDLQWAALLLAGLGVGWWACTRTAQAMRSADPGAIVWDEWLAMWLVLWVIAPAGWGLQLAAFALFRLLDAAKPGPVGWADRLFKAREGQAPGWRQGFGILFDDLVAALCTLILLALWRVA